MVNYKDNVMGYLMKAREMELAIDRDTLWSDEGKAQRKAQFVDPLVAAALAEADSWLRWTRKSYAVAQERELKARQAAAAKVDIAKRSYALSRARLLAENATNWDTIAGAVAEAVKLGDNDGLAAWADLEPLLRTRFDGGRSGPASDAHSGLRATYNQVSAALEAQVDPDVQAAQADLAATQDALADAEHTLTRIDRRRGYAGEGPPLFKDLVYPVATVETGGPDEPLGWSFETKGGGAFG